MLIALGTSLKLQLYLQHMDFMVAMGTSLADRAWEGNLLPTGLQVSSMSFWDGLLQQPWHSLSVAALPWYWWIWIDWIVNHSILWDQWFIQPIIIRRYKLKGEVRIGVLSSIDLNAGSNLHKTANDIANGLNSIHKLLYIKHQGLIEEDPFKNCEKKDYRRTESILWWRKTNLFKAIKKIWTFWKNRSALYLIQRPW